MKTGWLAQCSHFSRATWLLAVLLLAGCASHHPRDPIEPVNRAVYQFNDKADTWVIKPVAETYRDHVPSSIRTGVRNFFNNLGDASSAVNYGLQARPEASLYSFARFLLNSTAGILGVLDVTGEDGHRRFPQTGFGDTLARWGWRDSSYLVLPLLGPSTLRDGVGTAAGMSFQDRLLGMPAQQEEMAISLVSGISHRERLLGVDDTIREAALDPYAYTRDVWLQSRASKTGDTVPGQGEDDDMDIDELMK